MELYLIRHAEAVPLGEQGIEDDEQRPLTPRGEEQARALTKAFLRRGVQLDRLYTSPLVRARQTAEQMIAAGLNPRPELSELPGLAPDSKPRKLARFLLKQAGERVGLVGHMPHLAEFAGWLIGSKSVSIDIAKAGVVYIVCKEAPGKGMGELQALVTPLWYD